ncbi:hypothetical protein VTN77DRAFT_5858 [Rasamsonia byssochlamydoides]|uniref:uncharacterized protein n=1 Tax=Rasamsonia byssochlamydoides TaxID=89139 RepID=UPI00374474C0
MGLAWTSYQDTPSPFTQSISVRGSIKPLILSQDGHNHQIENNALWRGHRRNPNPLNSLIHTQVVGSARAFGHGLMSCRMNDKSVCAWGAPNS